MKFLQPFEKLKVKDHQENKIKNKPTSKVVEDLNFSSFEENLCDSSEEIIFEQSLSFNECGDFCVIENSESPLHTLDKSPCIRIFEYSELEASTLSLTDSQIENHNVDLDFSFGKKNPQKILTKK